MGLLNIFFEPFVLIYLALTNKPFSPQPLPTAIADFLDDMGLSDEETIFSNTNKAQNDVIDTDE